MSYDHEQNNEIRLQVRYDSLGVICTPDLLEELVRARVHHLVRDDVDLAREAPSVTAALEGLESNVGRRRDMMIYAKLDRACQEIMKPINSRTPRYFLKSRTLTNISNYETYKF
jgi:hypothetical protein